VHSEGVIPPELVPNVFEPLAGGHGLVKGHGLGLGLFISRELVQAHGGHIEVVSNTTGGTVFTVTMPRVHQGAPEPPPRDAITPAPLFVEGDLKN
jgi:signal transduction histidine kinase